MDRFARTDEASVRVGSRASPHRPAGAIPLVPDLDGTPIRSDLSPEIVGRVRKARTGPLAAIFGGALVAGAA